MDALVLEDLLFVKSEQPPLEGDSDWRKEFELD
jgi:carbamoyltransferase